MKAPVLFDCDPGWDDAMALALGATAPRLDVVAITTVHGNAPVEETTRNASRVLGLCDKTHLRIYQGCARALGADMQLSSAYPPPSHALHELPETDTIGAEHGVDIMIEVARKYGRALTLVATGPLTNVASAILRDSESMARIGRIVIMGGALSGGNVTADAEFNFFSDPSAAQITLSSPISKVVIPLETCARLPILSDLIRKLRDIDTPVAAFAAAVADERLATQGGVHQVPLYDVLATLYLLEPKIFSVVHGAATVDTRPLPYRGALWFDSTDPANATVGVTQVVEAEAAYSVLLAAVDHQC